MSIHSEIEPQAQAKQFKFEDVRGCDEAKDELVEVCDGNRTCRLFWDTFTVRVMIVMDQGRSGVRLDLCHMYYCF